MSIWTRIAEAISALAKGQGLWALFDQLRAPPERSVAFTIAVVALGAKLAKADGQVTRDEVTAFRQVFHIPPEEEANAARVFNLARTDVAGYEQYAARIAAMFPPESGVLCDLIEGLFHIALADGEYHPNEDDFLSRVAQIFGLSAAQFRGIRTRFVTNVPTDPYDVLGVTPDMPLPEIRKAWHREVIASHPDSLVARGLPEEAIKMAEKRLIDVNTAWEEIQAKAA